jgi:hypothetical protein
MQEFLLLLLWIRKFETNLLINSIPIILSLSHFLFFFYFYKIFNYYARQLYYLALKQPKIGEQ